MKSVIAKRFCRLFVSLFLLTSVAQPAFAAMITTSQLIGHAKETSIDQQDRIHLREQVTEVLIEHGVSATAAAERAAALSDHELRLLQQKIDALPAGQGALEVFGVVFLVLLILEILGVTNIFNRL